MTTDKLDQQIGALAKAIDKTPPDQQQGLRAQVTHLVEAQRGRGAAVPDRLLELQTQVDRETDDFFDNMPV